MSYDGSSCKSYIKHPTEKERLDNLAFTSFPEDYLPYTSAYQQRDSGRAPPYLVWDERRPRISRKRRRKCCSTAVLISAIALIVTAILAVVAISVYLGVITNLFRSPVLSLSGKFRVSRGDKYSDELLNATSKEFLLKAETYQAMVENAFLTSSLEPAFIAARIHSFRPGMEVFFRVYLDRRKLDQDDSNTVEIIRSLVNKNSPAFGALSIEQGSVEIDENEAWIALPSSKPHIIRHSPPHHTTASFPVLKKTSSHPPTTISDKHPSLRTFSPSRRPTTSSLPVIPPSSRNPVPVDDIPATGTGEVQPVSPHNRGDNNLKFNYGQWKPVPIEDKISPSFGDQRTPPGRGSSRLGDTSAVDLNSPHRNSPPPRPTSKPSSPVQVGFGSVRVLDDPLTHIDSPPQPPAQNGRTPLRRPLPIDNGQSGDVASSIMSSVSLVVRPAANKNTNEDVSKLEVVSKSSDKISSDTRKDHASYRYLDVVENGDTSSSEVSFDTTIKITETETSIPELRTSSSLSEGTFDTKDEFSNTDKTEIYEPSLPTNPSVNISHEKPSLNSSSVNYVDVIDKKSNFENSRNESVSTNTEFPASLSLENKNISYSNIGVSTPYNIASENENIDTGSESLVTELFLSNTETSSFNETEKPIPSTQTSVVKEDEKLQITENQSLNGKFSTSLEFQESTTGGPYHKDSSISDFTSESTDAYIHTIQDKTEWFNESSVIYEATESIAKNIPNSTEKIQNEELSVRHHMHEGHGFHQPLDEHSSSLDETGDSEVTTSSVFLNHTDSTTLATLLLESQSFSNTVNNSNLGPSTIRTDSSDATITTDSFDSTEDTDTNSTIRETAIVGGIPKVVPQLPDIRFNPNDIDSEDGGNVVEEKDDLLNQDISDISTMSIGNISLTEIIRHITTMPPMLSTVAISLGKHPIFISKKCSEDQMLCDSGECVDLSSRCNMQRNCRDNSDEKNCTCSEFLKVMGQSQKICDGIEDCKDHSDEIFCRWCKPGQVNCPQTKFCINQTQICDGHDDCPNEEDEKHCVKLATSVEDAEGYHYRQSGYLMVRKEGKWGKLCLANVEDTREFRFKLDDLGKAVCSTLTHSNSSTTKPVQDHENRSQSYFSITKPSTRNNRSLALFSPSTCRNKDVVKVKCGSLECGLRPKSTSSRRRVVGGVSAASGSWPWQVALYKEGDFQCGAVLITDTWLVSAGHCFYSSQTAYWIARLGLLRRGSELPSPYDQVRRIDRIILHPEYVDKGFINDIAMLRLERPVLFSDFLRPICLPMESEDPSLWHKKQCSVVGWGKLYEIGHTFPDSLQEVRLPVISTEECRKRIMFLTMYHITDNMFCAGYERGGKDGCLGDSGGPLMCQREDGRWLLLGVISNGDGCGRPGRPGVYTKLIKYLDWIKNTTESQYINNPYIDPCDGVRCNLGQCIPPYKVCDTRWDCSDGKDEDHCTD